MSRVATPFSWHASTALRVSTSTTASWNDAATKATGTGSPRAWRPSTQRATAVFSPENDTSYRCRSMSRAEVRPAREGDRRRAPVPDLGHRVAADPVDVRATRERQPEQPGDLVERLSRRVVDRAAQRGDLDR